MFSFEFIYGPKYLFQNLVKWMQKERKYTLGPCLVPRKFYKIFHIPRHIESLDTCMKY